MRDDTGVSAVESSPSSSGSDELESRGEVERDDDPTETRQIVQLDGVVSDDVSKNGGVFEARVVSDLADRTVRFDRDWQPVRRSVSMDLSCASIIYEVGDEGCSDHTRSKTIEKRNSSNICRVKRSFSFSGKRKNSKITVDHS